MEMSRKCSVCNRCWVTWADINGRAIHECGGPGPSPKMNSSTYMILEWERGRWSPVSCPHWPFETELYPAVPGVDNLSPTPNCLVCPQSWPSAATLPEACHFPGCWGDMARVVSILRMPPFK